MRLFVAVVLMLVTLGSSADSELSVPFRSAMVGGNTELGAIEVEGVGKVSLTARKQGSQLVVHAQDPDGTVIGRAETVIGLQDTPVYVKTGDGLKKITIYWGSE